MSQTLLFESLQQKQRHGVGTSRAVRIDDTYGADAIPLVSENTYRLA